MFIGKVFPGAIITRVAKSHIRVGTFQYFASLGKYNLVKELMDYVIKKFSEAFIIQINI